MWWHKKPSPKNLEEWLEIATKGIVPLEAEAIAREIKSHYQDELEFQMSYGKTQVEAERIAFAELGNAYRENRQFANSHVFVSELNHYITERKDSSIALGLALAGFIALAIFEPKIKIVPPMIYIGVFSNFLESYFLERGQLLNAIKASQRANLFMYPLFFISLGLAFFQDLGDWQFLLFLAFICWTIYGFFSGVRESNERIWKFQHYFQKYPQESHIIKRENH